MNEDATLLRRFAEDHADDAFTELVQRHLALVHATALRRVGGDVHLAQDVAQTVFISLARKAASLHSHASLAGWLYVSTHHAAAEVVRREQRRKQRETSAHTMNLASTPEGPTADPATLRPLLDDGLLELPADDRDAVVLRFFAQRSFAEIGTALRITEEAARKRVDRALEKLQSALSLRGITSTSAALGTALTAAGITTAPATLVSQIAGIALAESALLPAAAVTSSLTSALLPTTAMAAVLTGLWTILPQQRANAAMTAEIARLEQTPFDPAHAQSEIDRLARAVAQARTPPSRVQPITPSALATVSQSPSTTPAPAANAKKVQVTPKGALQWEGETLTLDKFLVRLADYQASAGSNGSQLIVKGDAVRFPQLNWVLDEARKAGITSLIVESDSEPDSSVPTLWF